MIEAISAKEKELVGHAERIIREQEGLEDALNGAFISNMVGSERDALMDVGPVLQRRAVRAGYRFQRNRRQTHPH